MARAAYRLYGSTEELDLRVPIAAALVEIYGASLDEQQIAELVEAMVPIEAAELDPRTHLAAKQP